MVQAVRATDKGIAALEAYLEGSDISVRGMRKWTPSNDEVALLIVAPNPHEWVWMRDLLARIREDGLEVKDLTASLLTLEQDGLMQIFREITDATYLRCDIGQWHFFCQWTTLRKQAHIPNIAHELMDHGFINVVGNPPMKVTLS